MMHAPGYEPLAEILRDAFAQAAFGKGKERHADERPFAEQPMQMLCDLYGHGFALGQAAKKSQESMRLPYERARAELLGAIVYTAGAVLALDRANGAGAAAAEQANDNAPPPVGCLRAFGCTKPFGHCQRLGVCQA